MDILGISAFYHDSAACLLRDGKILAAAQEERFTRKKHDPLFAKHIYKLISIRTNQAAGCFLGLDDEKVYRIDKKMLEGLALKKLDDIGAPRYIR